MNKDGFELADQWLCKTCRHCQNTLPPNSVDCAQNPDQIWEIAIHIEDRCGMYEKVEK